MRIEVKKTTDWQLSEWNTYAKNFNQVFDKNYTVDFFKHKYLNSIDNFSYHALLKTDEEVVGGCTVIPYTYKINNKSVRIGLAVDVFIAEEYRTDPLALYRMYKKLKKELVASDILLVVAVPNDTAYSYWKNIVKWKDVGYLSYYALPVRIGKIVNSLPAFFSFFSLLGSKLLIGISSIFNTKQKEHIIQIDRTNSIIEKQRYTDVHQQIRISDTYFSYRIVDEDGIYTAYLIDFYNTRTKKKDNCTLRKAIKYLGKNESCDLILFVGKLSFFQLLLLKVPFKQEPKHLYFTVDTLDENKFDNPDLILDINNWDFGLFNYDVR